MKRTHAALAATFALSLAYLAPIANAQDGPAQPSISQVASQDPWGPLKHVHAGVLDVAYAEIGPANGPVVILLHGWPYDIHSYEEVAPALAAKGYRAIVPHLRGYGTTRFLSNDTFRNGQPAALALDIVAF